MSHWIDPDSSDTQISRESCDAVRAQLAWAAHLGLQAVVLPPPSQPNACARYAQLINQVNTHTYTYIRTHDDWHMPRALSACHIETATKASAK